LEDGKYDSFTKDGIRWSNCEQQVKISYYSNQAGQEGEIVTGWVGRFLDFQKRLRPEKFPFGLDADCSDIVRPVTIDYYCYEIEWYGIRLYTDLWFPRVVGWMDADAPYYDNSELAALNTPRLNRFLQRTKELILSLGGTWELGNSYNNEKGTRKEDTFKLLNCYQGLDNIAPECKVTEDGISLELNIKPRNYWCVINAHDYGSIPAWYAEFPIGRFKNQQDFWPLVKTILEVGQQEEILCIFADDDDFQRFIQDIEAGNVPIPSIEDIQKKNIVATYKEKLGVDILPRYLNKIIVDTRICYYNQYGEIADEYPREPGKILQQLYYSYNEIYADHYFKTYANLYLPVVLIDDDFLRLYNSNYETSFSIKLLSDIWFPQVPGYLERKAGIRHNPYSHNIWYNGGFDNQELAFEHTPRLNKFIAAVAKKVEEMGGAWSINKDINNSCHELMTLTGINLDF
jgi:hypothetical protein